MALEEAPFQGCRDETLRLRGAWSKFSHVFSVIFEPCHLFITDLLGKDHVSASCSEDGHTGPRGKKGTTVMQGHPALWARRMGRHRTLLGKAERCWRLQLADKESDGERSRPREGSVLM